MSLQVRIAATLFLGWMISLSSHADILVLKKGGRVEGTVLNPKQDPRTEYVVRLETGGRVTLPADRVESYSPTSAMQKKYQSYLTRMPASAKGNKRLADWCAENGLKAEAKFHWEETVRLNPDGEQGKAAHRKLGHRFLDGRWMASRDEFMKSRGMEFYEGAYRLPQEIEIVKRKRETELAQKKIAREIKRWRGWIGKSEKRKQLRTYVIFKIPTRPRR